MYKGFECIFLYLGNNIYVYLKKNLYCCFNFYNRMHALKCSNDSNESQKLINH